MFGSVVKITNVCAGTAGVAYSNSATPLAYGTDACVVQATVLDDNAVRITALALDGADNLWVRPWFAHYSPSSAMGASLLVTLLTWTPFGPTCRTALYQS